MDDFHSSEIIDDSHKSKEQLIAELTALRGEMLVLKQSSRFSETSQGRSPQETETRSRQGGVTLPEETQIYTILLVDDSEIDRTTCRLFLTHNAQNPYNIVEFSDAEAALVWCRDHTPDILLIDYVLPGMNGLEFLSQLQQKVGHQNTPCIIMTSQHSSELGNQSLKSGAKDFLDKARMTPEGLNRAITHLLQKTYWIREQELQREQQHLVNMIAYSIRQSFRLEDIFQYTINDIRHRLQCDRVIIYQAQVFDGYGQIITESVIDPNLSILGQKIPDNDFTQDEKWLYLHDQGYTYSIEDSDEIGNDDDSADYQEFLQSFQIRSKLAAPIVQDNKLWGLLIAHHCTAPRYWTTAEIEFLSQLATQVGMAIQTAELNQKAEREHQERKKIEKVINEIATALIAKTGEDFFQLLVNYLCRILEVDYICIAELINAEFARTLAVSHKQQIIDNFEINVTNSPCREILQTEANTVTIYPNHAKEIFPDHNLIQSANIQACLGIPLVNASQEVIGLLTVFHHTSIENIPLAEEVLKIFAGRAGAELERQQIEAKLRQSEADLLEAQRIAHVGHWKWDRASNEVWWSEEIYRIFGLPLTQKITYSFFLECVCLDDRERVLEEIENALQGQSYRTIYRICRPDGTIRFLKAIGEVIFDGAGNSARIRGVALDITDLKKVEHELQTLNVGLEERVKERTSELTRLYLRLKQETEERQQIEEQKQDSELFYAHFLEEELLERHQIEQKLRDSEIQYRRIVETASEGIWQLDENNKTVFVNPRMAEMLGYSPEEIVEKSVLDFIEETDREAVEYLIEQRDHTLINQYDLQFRRKNGSTLWAMISTRPIVDESGQYLGRLKMVTDISDRKKAETDLQEREAFLRAVGDNIPRGVLYQLSRELDGSYRVMYISAGVEKETGYKVEEIYQNSHLLFEFVIDSDRPLLLQKYQESFENLSIFDIQVRAQYSPQEGIRWIRLCASPRRLDDGRTIWDGIRLDITELKRSEEKFRQLAETIQDVFYIYSEDYQDLIYISPAYERMWQLSRESIEQDSLSFLTRIHPQDRDRVIETIEDSMEDNMNFSLEYRLLLPDGSIRWIYDRVFFIYNEAGEPYRVAGLASDISDRKQAEADLYQSRMLLDTLTSRIPGTLYSLVKYPDHSASFDYLSSGSRELLEYEADEIINNPLLYLNAIHPDDREQYHATLEAAVAQKQFTCEWRMITPSGKIKWVQARSRLEQRSDRNIWHGVLLDISDRKQAEAEIQEFNRRWRSVLDNIQMIVVELDKEGNVEYINPFFQKISQFTPEEVLGKHWFSDFVPLRLRPILDTLYKEVLQDEVPSDYENPILMKSGEERMINWRNSVLQDNAGQTMGLIAIGEDITEQHRLERMKSEFISIVSHELKTPLTAIQASLSLLYDKIINPVSEEGEEIIGIATEGIDRLVRLVNDILDLERLRSGQLVLKKSDCNVQEILANAIAQIQELAKPADIEIKISADSFSVFADGDRVIQVLINLLSNAIKFSPPHSTIDLSVEYQMSEPSHPPDMQPSFLFSVRDQGRGIPSQNLETIFERFQQVDASDSREKGGTGLGLAICRDIVEQHGGKIGVESILGQGSTFYFTIPTEAAEALSYD